MRPLEISDDEFRRLSAELVDLSAAFLSSLESRAIFPETSGAAVERLFAVPAPERGLGEEALAGLRDVMQHARAQNGRFFGYVQGPGEPMAALGDLFASILNQNMTAWRSSPSGVTIERTVVRWLAEAVGCGGFSGTLTGGGSAANLMGLAMARERGCPQRTGLVVQSRRSGLCVRAGTHGGAEGGRHARHRTRESALHRVRRRLPDDSAELERAIREDKAVGNGRSQWWHRQERSTPEQSIRLRAIAEIAHAQDVWVHVDGAYGALGRHGGA